VDLEKLKVFYMVAKTGKFTQAASALNITQPALTRSIQLLEYSLKTRLFERSHKGVILTNSGEKLYELAKRIVDDVAVVEKNILESSDEPSGELKVVTTPGMASIWLSDLIPGFLNRYPAINLNIQGITTDFESHLSQADIVIRTYISHHTHLIQRKVMNSQHKMWASNDYLDKFKPIKKLTDLSQHQLIVYEKASFNTLANNTWILEKGANIDNPRKPYLIINSLEGLIACARNGLGIIGLPEELVRIRNQDHKLINVLSHIDGPIVEIFCIYQEKFKNSKKITAFADYLEEHANMKK
jgi:DNA-binding transcriptional LysR family regulator